MNEIKPPSSAKSRRLVGCLAIPVVGLVLVGVLLRYGLFAPARCTLHYGDDYGEKTGTYSFGLYGRRDDDSLLLLSDYVFTEFVLGGSAKSSAATDPPLSIRFTDRHIRFADLRPSDVGGKCDHSDRTFDGALVCNVSDAGCKVTVTFWPDVNDPAEYRPKRLTLSSSANAEDKCGPHVRLLRQGSGPSSREYRFPILERDVDDAFGEPHHITTHGRFRMPW